MFEVEINRTVFCNKNNTGMGFVLVLDVNLNTAINKLISMFYYI